MKNSVLLMFLMVGFAFAASAQSSNEKIVIKTSAVCETCKTTIEGALYKLDGVKSAYLNVNTKEVKVKYDGTVVSADNIKAAIVMAGYDADEIPADEAAYGNLHGCCKKDVVH